MRVLLRRILRLAVAAGVVFALVNWPIQSRRTAKSEIEPGNRGVPVAGGTLNARVAGKGPPVLLIHGWMASLHWWDGVAGPLARRYTVVRPDLLGFGSSAKPCPGYGMNQQADRMIELMDRLGVRRATVVGFSMGGLVAASMAERHPERIAGVAFVGSPSGPGQTPGHLVQQALGWPILGPLLETLATEATMRPALRASFAPETRIPDRLVEDALAPTWCSAAHSADRIRDFLDQRSLDRRLRDYERPMLAVFGALDEEVAPRPALRVFARLPGMRTKLMARSGHAPMVDEPAAFLRVITPFLARASRR